MLTNAVRSQRESAGAGRRERRYVKLLDYTRRVSGKEVPYASDSDEVDMIDFLWVQAYSCGGCCCKTPNRNQINTI